MSRVNALKVPTNLITGFLGSGKTSTILHLLEQRAEQERIAVLVNEFGAIGIDGSLISSQYSPSEGIAIAEVPGGCMCCTSGPLTQVALNKLITSARPQRLLIEASGLGHPLEVLQLLSSEYYRDAISLGKTICIVDARKLSDSRYTDHSTFNQQIAIADIVVGNKDDMYQRKERQQLIDYVENRGRPSAETIFASHGAVSIDVLEGPIEPFIGEEISSNKPLSPPNNDQNPIPVCGYLCESNSAEGFESVGWRFHPSKIFSRKKIVHFLSRIVASRAKAVVITSDGVYGYNRSEDNLREIELDDCLESRIEIIAPSRDLAWEGLILDCLSPE